MIKLIKEKKYEIICFSKVCACCVFILLESIWSQSLHCQTTYKRILNSLDQYTTENTPEKVYVHTDKDQYTNGETIWFKSYVINGISHQASAASKVLYVELLDPNDSLLVQKKIYVDAIGAAGDIELGYQYEEGTYLLRAYTNYMRNARLPSFFQKEIPIWYQKIEKEDIKNPISDMLPKEKINIQNTSTKKYIEEKPIVQFYPEGGNLVAGMDNVVAIKATDKEGNDIEISGVIEDNEGNTVSFFKTFKYGLGKFNFQPKIGKEYIGKVSINSKTYEYPVKPIAEKGYRMQVVNKGEELEITLQSNTEETLFGALLVGHLRGKHIFDKRIEERKSAFNIKLKVRDLPEGILHFTLFLPGGVPVCNRLVFNHEKEDSVSLLVQPDKKVYDRNEPVEIKVRLTEEMNDSLSGNFSLSVARSSASSLNPSNTIKSWFLIDTDLKNKIENPNYFFLESKQQQRRYLLDIFLLTQQWQRFSWQDLISANGFDLSYPPEKGLYISGTTSLFNKPLATKQTEIRLNVMDETIFQDSQKTDSKGRFEFGPYVIKDSVDVFLEAKIPLAQNKKREKYLSIKIDSFWTKVPLDSTAKRVRNQFIEEEVESYLKAAKRKKVVDFTFDGINRLDEVFLKVKKKTLKQQAEEEINAFTRHGRPDYRIFPDSLPGGASGQSIMDLLRRVPGLRVFGNFPNQTIASTAFPNPRPLILIDEQRVTMDEVNLLTVEMITFIDYLRISAAYGLGSNGGVLLIYTSKDFDFIRKSRVFPGIADFKFPGFDTPNDFSKKESNMIESPDKPNYDTTLFWNPNLRLKNEQDTSVQFNCGSDPGEYSIKVEGVTTDGHIITYTASFEIAE